MRASARVWLGVFALALALRLAYLWEWHASPLFTTPIGDARAYLDWARQIAAGDWYGHEVFYQAPLYPYLLALVLRATGSETWGPRLVQALGGALACVLLGRAAERFFRPAVGVAAGIGLAVYAPAVYFDGLIQKPALDGLLLSALLYALSGTATPPGPGRALVSGALLGLLALSRENALALAPVVAAWLASLPGAGPALRRTGAVAALAAGLALVLVPIALRNQSLGGGFLPTTSQLGPNLWIGNHPGASGRYEPLRPGRGSAVYEREDARALAEQAVGHGLSPGEVSAYWRDRALAFARDQPLAWLELLGRKAFFVWHARELPDTEGIEAYGEASRLLRALDAVFHFGVLAPLALAGLVAERRAWRRLWILPGLALTLAASIAVFYVFARYRYALVPVLMPLAAAGALAGLAALRAGALGPALRLAGVALAAAVALNWPLASARSEGLTHYGLGSALLDAGQLAQARVELQRALDELPDVAPVRLRFAELLRKSGDPAGAIRSYDAALALDPGLADAHVGRGAALEALGRLDEAEVEYRRALALDPRHPDANNNLASARLRAGALSEAVALYRVAIRERPDQADFHANLATALARSGELGPALDEFAAALALDPGHLVAHLNRAIALLQLGRVDEARVDLGFVVARAPPASPYAQTAQAILADLAAR